VLYAFVFAWLEVSPPWLRLAYCFDSVIVCDRSNASRSGDLTWLEDYLTIKRPGSFSFKLHLRDRHPSFRSFVCLFVRRVMLGVSILWGGVRTAMFHRN